MGREGEGCDATRARAFFGRVGEGCEIARGAREARARVRDNDICDSSKGVQQVRKRFYVCFNFRFDLLTFNRYENECEIQVQADLARKRRLREQDVQDQLNIAEAMRRSDVIKDLV